MTRPHVEYRGGDWQGGHPSSLYGLVLIEQFLNGGHLLNVHARLVVLHEFYMDYFGMNGGWDVFGEAAAGPFEREE